MLDYQYINVTIKPPLAYIMLNRPSAKNALNREMRIEIGKVFEELVGLNDVKGIIIHGNGNNFCGGGDVKEMVEVECPYEAEALSTIEQNTFRKIETIKKPVVAAIEGFAIGAGFDLALSCDIRIATPDAKLGFPEVKLGIIVGGGGIYRLYRNVGLAITKELLYTGSLITAQQALEYRIINKISNKAVLPFCEDFLISKILDNSCSAIAEYKTLLAEDDISYASLAKENKAIGSCFRRPDRQEGINAFIEKRKPHFL